MLCDEADEKRRVAGQILSDIWWGASTRGLSATATQTQPRTAKLIHHAINIIRSRKKKKIGFLYEVLYIPCSFYISSFPRAF